MRSALAAPAALLLLSLPARAQEISLLDIAIAEREEKAALERVEKEHGNKPPQELKSGERAQIIREQQAASRAVFEERKLDPKAFAGRVMRLTPTERALVEAEKKRLDDEEKAALEKAKESEELEITRGIDDAHPVDVYREPGAVPVENLQEEGGAVEAGKPQKASKPSRAAAPQKSPRGKKSRRK